MKINFDLGIAIELSGLSRKEKVKLSMRHNYKRLMKKVLVKNRILRFTSHFVRRRVVILRYHSVQKDPEIFSHSIGGIIQTKAIFEEQMEILARHFSLVTLDDILFFLRDEKTIPERAVAITFDDGFADNFEIAAPILKQYGIMASFYVTVNSIESQSPPWFVRLRHAFFTTQKEVWFNQAESCVLMIRNQEERNTAYMLACKQCVCLAGDTQEEMVCNIERSLDVDPYFLKEGLMMNWKQIKELHKAGHIIGSHTLTHPNLAHVINEDLNRELTESKHCLERELGTPVYHFSYPSPYLEPHWSRRTVEVTREVGYQTAVTCTPGPVRAGDNPLVLKRIFAPLKNDEFLWDLECTLCGRVM